MSAVHLSVVELEGDGQGRLQPTFAVAPPCKEWVVVDADVRIDDAVESRTRHCRSADYHGIIV